MGTEEHVMGKIIRADCLMGARSRAQSCGLKAVPLHVPLTYLQEIKKHTHGWHHDEVQARKHEHLFLIPHTEELSSTEMSWERGSDWSSGVDSVLEQTLSINRLKTLLRCWSVFCEEKCGFCNSYGRSLQWQRESWNFKRSLHDKLWGFCFISCSLIIFKNVITWNLLLHQTKQTLGDVQL